MDIEVRLKIFKTSSYYYVKKNQLSAKELLKNILKQ